MRAWVKEALRGGACKFVSHGREVFVCGFVRLCLREFCNMDEERGRGACYRSLM